MDKTINGFATVSDNERNIQARVSQSQSASQPARRRNHRLCHRMHTNSKLIAPLKLILINLKLKIWYHNYDHHHIVAAAAVS